MSKKSEKYVRLRTYKGRPESAYVYLLDHPASLEFGLVVKSVMIHQLIDDYHGPSLILQFDKMNRAVGIEILYPTQIHDEDDEE